MVDAPQPDAPMAADTGTDPSAPADTGAADAGPTVLLTVMDLHDGTYSLIQGDEDEAGEGDDASAAAAPADGSAPAPDAGASSGQTFDSVGSLLKAILDLLKTHEESASGDGSAQDNFDAGFSGGSSASPPKSPALAQKY